MKKNTGSNLVGFVFLVAIVMYFFLILIACNTGSKSSEPPVYISSKDTVEVLVRAVKGGPIYFPLLGAYQTYINYQPKDTLKPSDTIARIRSIVDTIWHVRSFDTMRDAAKRPMFDSLHHVRFQPIWQQVDKHFIQPITVPR